MSDLDLNKRYWVFSFSDYYPSGGMHDIRACIDNIRDAYGVFLADFRENGYICDNYQILDTYSNNSVDLYVDEGDCGVIYYRNINDCIVVNSYERQELAICNIIKVLSDGE